MHLILCEKFGVTEKKGIPVVSSKFVADVFGKRHDNVIQSINNMKCSEQFRLLNFQESTYKNEQGKKQPEYLMTRDGFSILVMGFTGRKAMEFKEAYIKAFNQMESFIKDLLEAKQDFPEFTDAILQAHSEPKHFHFSNECNMINQIVTGMTAKQFKEFHNLDKVSSIRPHLTPTQLEAVKALQRIDIGLIYTVTDYNKRKEILEKQYQRLSQKRLSA